MPLRPEEHEALWTAIRNANANWQPGDTSMTDLTVTERRTRLGYTPGPDEPSLEQRAAQSLAHRVMATIMSATPPATAVDWRHYNGNNYVTSVKDQGNCGSCVAFGTTATMESRARIIQQIPVNANSGGILPDLSPAHLFYCGNTAPTDPCKAGWQPGAALTFATNPGVVPLSCYAYTSGNQTCSPCTNWQQLVTTINGSHEVTSIPEMKAWLASRGPLITCLSVYEDFYAYTSGVYAPTSNVSEGGHCVSCVGYDDTKGAWVCKNSWGTRWGEGGFFWIKYGECGIDATMWAIDTFSAIYTQKGPHRAVRP